MSDEQPPYDWRQWANYKKPDEASKPGNDAIIEIRPGAGGWIVCLG
jgi:hypothetical protein